MSNTLFIYLAGLFVLLSFSSDCSFLTLCCTLGKSRSDREAQPTEAVHGEPTSLLKFSAIHNLFSYVHIYTKAAFMLLTPFNLPHFPSKQLSSFLFKSSPDSLPLCIVDAVPWRNELPHSCSNYC